MASEDLLSVTIDDGRALLTAAESDWARPVPHCPAWNASELVGHLGGIYAWMATIVTTGQPVRRADREVPPDDLDARKAWYLRHLERTTDILAGSDPETGVWTFSSLGVNTVAWWRRRIAVETVIHRWDVEHAVSLDASTVRPLEQDVATEGITEFVDEFLPGLVSQPEVVGLSGVLQLEATDARSMWRGNLGATASESSTTDTKVVRGTSSNLLLWLTNREPVSPVLDDGSGLGSAWRQLQR